MSDPGYHDLPPAAFPEDDPSPRPKGLRAPPPVSVTLEDQVTETMRSILSITEKAVAEMETPVMSHPSPMEVDKVDEVSTDPPLGTAIVLPTGPVDPKGFPPLQNEETRGFHPVGPPPKSHPLGTFRDGGRSDEEEGNPRNPNRSTHSPPPRNETHSPPPRNFERPTRKRGKRRPIHGWVKHEGSLMDLYLTRPEWVPVDRWGATIWEPPHDPRPDHFQSDPPSAPPQQRHPTAPPKSTLPPLPPAQVHPSNQNHSFSQPKQSRSSFPSNISRPPLPSNQARPSFQPGQTPHPPPQHHASKKGNKKRKRDKRPSPQENNRPAPPQQKWAPQVTRESFPPNYRTGPHTHYDPEAECRFCSGGHRSAWCPLSVYDRERIIRRQGYCTCGDWVHPDRECTTTPCHCGASHHPWLCNKM